MVVRSGRLTIDRQLSTAVGAQVALESGRPGRPSGSRFDRQLSTAVGAQVALEAVSGANVGSQVLAGERRAGPDHVGRLVLEAHPTAGAAGAQLTPRKRSAPPANE